MESAGPDLDSDVKEKVFPKSDPKHVIENVERWHMQHLKHNIIGKLIIRYVRSNLDVIVDTNVIISVDPGPSSIYPNSHSYCSNTELDWLY